MATLARVGRPRGARQWRWDAGNERWAGSGGAAEARLLHQVPRRLERGLRDAADHGQREARRRLALERVQAHDLARVGVRVVLAAAEEASFSDVASKPGAPAVQLQRGRPVEDDALCFFLVVLREQHHRLVEVLLVQREAAGVLHRVKQHRALLYER